MRTLGKQVTALGGWRKAAYVFVNGFLSIGILAAVAAMTGSPFVFPSLGPTAYMLFSSPLADSATPRACLIGHAIGILCGFGALAVTGLLANPDPPPHPVTASRALAAALALAATAGGMVLARVNHAPACATTLIVALGFITRPEHLILIEISVLLLVIQAFALNRLVGIRYPVWR